MTKPPLNGLLVLDLSRILAGPYCTQVLADLGATVWKVESLQGDDTRRWGPPFSEGESAYYLSTNRGKQSLAVNLKNARGQALVQQLASKADVLVENFKVGDLKRYGLAYEQLSTINPGLIYLSITGFGHNGPRAQEPGYDAAIQALSGIMSITGEPEGPPVKVGVAWVDVLTGLSAGMGVLAALYERERSGRGQHLDVALFDVALASLVNQAQSYLQTGQAPEKLGSAHPQIVPYQAFATSDGWLMLAVGNDAQFKRCCEVLGAEELWQDERFHSNAGRVTRRQELIGKLQAIFKTQPKDWWLKRLNAAKVPATPVNNLAEALADPQVAARNMLWLLAHSRLHELSMPGSPLQHFSRTPLNASAARPPPLKGEHSRELLQRVLGLDEEEIVKLEHEGVIATSE